MYRQRFGLTAQPMPKDAHGKTFFEPSHRRGQLWADIKKNLADAG